MLNVLKADNTREPFSKKKLIESIQRAGIATSFYNKVIAHVERKVYDGISTKEIYHHITEFLEKSAQPYSRTRYSLKQAIMDLGPTGYPFEDYIAKILELEGFTIKIRQIVQGACIQHEIDIIASKHTINYTNIMKIMVEVKFHNRTGIKTNVHVPMYTKSRFEDIKNKYNLTQAMLVTNTKTTIDAIAYAKCVGMEIISWSYPDKKNLRDLVEKYQLFPITALASMPMLLKQKLLEQGIVLCTDICANQSLLDLFGLDRKSKDLILAESSFVCSIS